MIESLLRAAYRKLHKEDAILLFEEPELFLHPHGDWIMSVIGFPKLHGRVRVRGARKVARKGSPTITHGRLTFPKNHEWSSSLAWLRRQVIEILDQHKPSAASIKCIEPIAKKSVERYHVDGVIQEVTFAELGVECTTNRKLQLKHDIRDFTEPARYLNRVLDNALGQPNTTNLQEAALSRNFELPPE